MNVIGEILSHHLGGCRGLQNRGGRLREAVGGRRGVVSHHGVPGGGVRGRKCGI
jgi:hypothetical protein